MPGTGRKVCVRGGGGGGWWLKPIIVFSLVQAEQYLCSQKCEFSPVVLHIITFHSYNNYQE